MGKNLPFGACLNGEYLSDQITTLLQNYSIKLTCGESVLYALYDDASCTGGTETDLAVAVAALEAIEANLSVTINNSGGECDQVAYADCGYLTVDWYSEYPVSAGECADITLPISSETNWGPSLLRFPDKCYQTHKWSWSTPTATVQVYANETECTSSGASTSYVLNNNDITAADGCNEFDGDNRTVRYTYVPEANMPTAAPTGSPTVTSNNTDNTDAPVTSTPTPAPVSKAVNSKGVFWVSLVAAVVSVASVF